MPLRMPGRWSRPVASAVLAAACLAPGASAVAEPRAPAAPIPLAIAAPDSSDAARRFVDWIVRSGDHRRRPFTVVDKKQARVFVFDGNGELVGESSALLGATAGDESSPGVGARAQVGLVRADERTTPAGRFDSVPGRNLDGEHVVWADYATAFAIHRLRPGAGWKSREARLASPSPEDNRASLGCVVVPVAFYESTIEPWLGRSRAVVYVLPERRRMNELFGIDL